MPKGRGRKAGGKKSKVVKTREAGVQKMQREDGQRKAESKAIQGRGGQRSSRGF